jgi:hypothetical protein
MDGEELSRRRSCECKRLTGGLKIYVLDLAKWSLNPRIVF